MFSCSCPRLGDSLEYSLRSTGQAEPSGASASMPNTQQGTTESESQQRNEPADTQEETETGILVAYFSRTGENYDVGYIEKGSTHIIADMIAEQTGGDTFEIRTMTSYPDDYDECTDIAKQEQSENVRPERSTQCAKAGI